MKTRWLRRIAAVLIPVYLVFGLDLTDWPVRSRAAAAAAQPAKIKELPWTASQKLADEMGRLSRTVASLVAVGEDPGGLHQWHESLVAHRAALQALAEPVKEEWAGNETTMSQAGVPASALQRHREVGAVVQERLTTTLSLLSAALVTPASAGTLPQEVHDLYAQLESWQQTAGPVWNEVLPFGPAHSMAGASPLPDLGQPLPLPLAQGSPSDADLAQETEVDEEALVGVLSETGSELRMIAAWVYHNVHVQWYLDRQKGPMAVLQERAGNDTDVSGLLVSLLRRADIPARYAHGQVVLSSGYWPGLFGLSDRKAVVDYLTGSGVPVQEDSDSSLVVPHTWVEAWDKESNTWVALDAAWKSHVWPAPTQAVEPAFDLHRYMVQGNGGSPVAFAIGEGQGEAPGPVPMNLSDGMPRMRFSAVGQGSSWSRWPEGRAGEFSLSVGGAEVRLPIAKVHGKRIFINYVPASDDDRDLLSRFASGPPIYLLNIRPVVLVGGEQVGEGSTVPMGSVMNAQIAWQVGGQSETVQRQWLAGDPQSLIFLARPVAPSTLEQWQKDLLHSPVRTVEDLFGLQLSYLQFRFLEETERSAGRLAAAWRQQVVQGPHLTMASFSLAYERLFGIAVQEQDVRIAFDAARVAKKAQPLPGAPDAAVLFAIALGAEASYRESQAVSGTYGLESSSTITTLGAVAATGDSLVWACRLNGDQELPVIDASAETRQHLTQGFDRNLLVVAPRSTGDTEAYALIDPITGASGYFLSSGRNGSLSQWLGLKDKFWLIDWEIDLLMKVAPDQLDYFLPKDPEERKNSLRALMFGMVDGFAAGLEGEWETIEGTALTIWEGLKHIPESANFLWRLMTDGEFRDEIAQQMVQGLEDLIQVIVDLTDNWQEYLRQAMDELPPYVAEISGFELGHPMLRVWVVYYPVGWLWGAVAEIAVVALVTAGVGKLVMALPQAQRLLRALQVIVTRLPKGMQRVVKVAIKLDQDLPELNLLGVLSRAKHGKVRNYLDDTLLHLIDLDDDGNVLGLKEAFKPMLKDLSEALSSPPVEDGVYRAARSVWEQAGLSPEDAELLRFMRPEVFRTTDLANEHASLHQLLKDMRRAVDWESPIQYGTIMRKNLGPAQANDMIKGRNGRPKDRIFGYITRPEYVADARTPDELVALTRQDGFNGLVEKGNTHMYWIDFALDSDAIDVDIPFARELGGPEDLVLDESVWPFSGTGFTTTKNGRWVPEYRFKQRKSHLTAKGATLMGMDDSGNIFVRAVFDGAEWDDLRPDLLTLTETDLRRVG